jgi:transposase
MPMLEGKVDAVIGVDTHRDRHTAAILDPNGGLVAQLEIPSDQAGAEALLGFVTERAAGRRCWALEGTGCYGAGLASFLAAQVSGWSRSTGPSGPEAGAGPRATCWTPSGPAGRP